MSSFFRAIFRGEKGGPIPFRPTIEVAVVGASFAEPEDHLDHLRGCRWNPLQMRKRAGLHAACETKTGDPALHAGLFVSTFQASHCDCAQQRNCISSGSLCRREGCISVVGAPPFPTFLIDLIFPGKGLEMWSWRLN